MSRGWVYVIVNKSMPDLVKIGFSTKDPVFRAKELNNTGVPHPYRVVFDVLVHNPRLIERDLHAMFSERQEGKEWFKVSAREVADGIREIASDQILLEKVHDNSYFREDECDWQGAGVAEELCSEPGCNLSADRFLDGVGYCIWHLRMLRNPKKRESIRLLFEEFKRGMRQ